MRLLLFFSVAFIAFSGCVVIATVVTVTPEVTWFGRTIGYVCSAVFGMIGLGFAFGGYMCIRDFVAVEEKDIPKEQVTTGDARHLAIHGLIHGAVLGVGGWLGFARPGANPVATFWAGVFVAGFAVIVALFSLHQRSVSIGYTLARYLMVLAIAGCTILVGAAMIVFINSLIILARAN